MDLPVTALTHWDLLSVYRSQDAIETYWHSLVREFSDVSHVVHDDGRCGFSADAARFLELRARSHLNPGTHEVDLRILSYLESISVFCPIMVEIITHRSIGLSSLSLDGDGKSLPEAFEDARD